MARAILIRLLLVPPTLLAVSFLTFLLLDLVPLDRAEREVAMNPSARSEIQRIEAVRALRERYGLLDPATGERPPVVARWWAWVGHAARLDFAPRDETAGEFRSRMLRALSISTLIGVLALTVALALGIPLGWWLGLRAGSVPDRCASTTLLGVGALPEFLTATLLVLLFGGPLRALLPVGGLRSPGADALGPVDQAIDLLAHLTLPVVVLAVGPTAWVSRLLRSSCAKTGQAEFVHAMRVLGAPRATISRRVLANSLGPLWTFLGMLLPWVATGAVVVESVFGIPGFGRLALEAIRARDVSTVMFCTLLVASGVALGSLCGDLMHRRGDPRVNLR